MPLHYSPSGDGVIYWLFWNPKLNTTVFVCLRSCFEEQSLENTLADFCANQLQSHSVVPYFTVIARKDMLETYT